MSIMRKGVHVPTGWMILAFVVGFFLSWILGPSVLVFFLNWLSEGISSLAVFLEEMFLTVGIPALVFLLICIWRWQLALAFATGCIFALILILIGIEPEISLFLEV